GFTVSEQELEPYRFAGAACQLVFVDGNFAPELSRISKLPSGLEVGGLAEKIEKDPGIVEQHLGRYLNTRRDAFAALNAAFLNDGAYVHIQRRAVIEQPICLLYVSANEDGPVMSHPLNLIVAEQESQAAMVEDYVSMRDGSAFSNTVTELVAY